jgi:hypothetical protein
MMVVGIARLVDAVLSSASSFRVWFLNPNLLHCVFLNEGLFIFDDGYNDQQAMAVRRWPILHK